MNSNENAEQGIHSVDGPSNGPVSSALVKTSSATEAQPLTHEQTKPNSTKFPLGNVPGGLNILGGYMNPEVVEQRKQAILAAVSEYGQACKDAAKAEMGSGTPTDSGEGKVSLTYAELEAKLSEAKTAAVEEYKSNDPTQFGTQDMENQKAALQAEFEAVLAAAQEKSAQTIKDLELKLSEKDANALEEAVAGEFEDMASVMLEKAQNLRKRSPDTVVVDPAPVDPSPVVE